MAGTDPLSAVTCAVVPVALRYWTDIPETLIEALVGLYSSTKSFVYWAPELPPPPYTSLMTRFEPSGAACAGATRASGVTTSPKAVVAITALAPRRVNGLDKRISW